MLSVRDRKVGLLILVLTSGAGLNPMLGSSEAHAQMSSSTCMAMGGGMIHCDTMDMGGANQSANDGGAALGRGIGALISRGREKAFQKKIGQMLADGDCEGAARFALEKGRLELGSNISRSCNSAPSAALNRNQSADQTVQASSAQLQTYLGKAASAIRTPVAIDDITTITKVEVVGTQLLLTANIGKEGVTFNDEQRQRLINGICASSDAQPLMQAGASIRVLYVGKTGQQIGSAMATRQQCGF